MRAVARESAGEHKKLLVTGCARSGTLYTAQVFQSLGLDVRHEMPVPPHGTMGRDGMVSWYMAVDDPHPPYGPSAVGFTFDTVIHQVRHPLRVIPSVAQFILRSRASRRYIERNAPQVRVRLPERFRPRRDRLILQASRYWVHWNHLARAKAGETLRLERLQTELPRLCRQLGIEFSAEAVEKIPRTINGREWYVQRPSWTVDWPEIAALDARVCDEVRALARSYGYE